MTPCIEWTGAVSSSGYGRRPVAGEYWYAHRWAYTAAFGEIPKGLYVLHRCDNKICVNPDHLFLGTQQDNMDDAKSKGIFIGRKPLNSTERILELYESFHMTPKEIAEELGVDATGIRWRLRKAGYNLRKLRWQR